MRGVLEGMVGSQAVLPALETLSLEFLAAEEEDTEEK
jgi:hypothetical protein